MKKFLGLLTLLLTYGSNSQDIRGSFIQTKWISGNTYSMNVTLLTNPTSTINRPTTPFFFNQPTPLGTLSLSSTYLYSGVKFRIYSGTYTYPQPASYIASCLDTFRVGGIKNMSNSITQKIYCSSFILGPMFGYPNTTPNITNYATSFSVSGNQVIYDPGFSDPDGDSLSFLLTSSYGVNYYLPSNATISSTGIFSFSKDSLGLYAFCIMVKEWRRDSFNQLFQVNSTQQDFLMNITPDVGFKNNEPIKHINIFPNPARDKIEITIEKAIFYELYLSDPSGKLIKKIPIREGKQTLDISGLNGGYYFLTIKNKDGSEEVHKILKD